MAQQKLYTEEQVREAIGFGYCNIDTISQDEYINSLTPIELPSDEEIEIKSPLFGWCKMGIYLESMGRPYASYS